MVKKLSAVFLVSLLFLFLNTGVSFAWFSMSNDAYSALAAPGINSGSGVLTVASGTGNRFPQTGLFVGVIWGSQYSSPAKDLNREYVVMTLSSGDTFTVLRGQEGTLAGTWPANSNVANVSSVAFWNELRNAIPSMSSPGDIGFGSPGRVNATEYNSTKVSGQPGINCLMDDYGTELFGVCLYGPHSATSMVASYNIHFSPSQGALNKLIYVASVSGPDIYLDWKLDADTLASLSAGAVIGQTVKWNGVAWVAANDNVGSGTYAISNNVISSPVGITCDGMTNYIATAALTATLPTASIAQVCTVQARQSSGNVVFSPADIATHIIANGTDYGAAHAVNVTTAGKVELYGTSSTNWYLYTGASVADGGAVSFSGFLLLEDNASHLLQEDGSSKIIL